MIGDFKFLTTDNKKRVFTDYLDAMDDYFLGNIPTSYYMERPAQFKMFNLNVMLDVFGRIPSYTIAFEPYDNNVESVYGTVDDLINFRLSVSHQPIVELTIRRGGITQETFSSYTIITHENVDTLNAAALIYAPEDRIIVRYKIL